MFFDIIEAKRDSQGVYALFMDTVYIGTIERTKEGFRWSRRNFQRPPSAVGYEKSFSLAAARIIERS